MRFVVGVVSVLLVWTVVVHGKPTEGDGELVLVKELRGSRTVRSTESALPRLLHTQFRVDGETVSLRLVRNTDIDTNVPFTFAKNKHEKVYVPDREDIALYQDDVQGAAISVTTKKTSTGQHNKLLEGSFNFNDSQYVIQPVDSISPELAYERFDGIPHRIHKVQLPKEYRTMAKQQYEEFKEKLSQSQLQQGTSKQRQKRDTAIASYHVELLFVLDHTIYDYWLAKATDRNDALSKIKYYYLHTMNGIDLAYKSIDSSVWGFMITPFLKEYYIAETAAESTWTETSIQQTANTVEKTVVNATAVLQKMVVWKNQDGRSWKNPDHAMIWTRYDIFGSALGTVGYAYTTGVCMAGLGVSVIEESGLMSWTIAAHELGHSLGAHHDGDGDSCSASDMFLMSATIGAVTVENRANAFTFSPCTLQSFKDLLSGVTDEFPRVCLTNRVCSHGVSTEGQDTLPGVTYSLDEQCAMYFGDGFTYLLYGDDTNETLCYTMHCLDSSQQYVYTLKRGATFGSPCGIDKCCYKGECVTDCSYPTSAPATTCTPTNLNTDVPQGCADSGEQFKINGQYTTCAELIVFHTHLCFSWEVARERLCCESCHRAGVRTQTQHYVTTDSTLTTVSPSSTTADREETSTAQRTSIVPSTSSIQTTTMTKATTTAHTTPDREETSTAQRTSIVPSTSSIQTTTMTKATTTAHTTHREETSTAQRTSIVPSTSSIQTTIMTKATTTAHTTLLCYTCGSYKNDMKQNCESANFGTTVCNECWVYRQDWDGTMVTYARGCQSDESNVASDNCDDFSSESCSTVGQHTVCRQCCKSDRCNNGKLTGNSAYVTAISYLVVTSTVALSLIVTTLL